MSADILYPKDIKKLKLKIDILMKEKKDESKVSQYNDLLVWINKIEDKFAYKCKKDEYLKACKDKDRYSLQLWKKDGIVSVFSYNLIANYLDEYSVDATILYEDA